ncbi:hypothetical protein ACGFI9_37170 [Micromonospora sp. NPDC048930]|uniref:hypothetical protein n=1 Tax=Micromonospora sp. NPDC048930 TaxID=3364261 RepID=UPI003717489B
MSYTDYQRWISRGRPFRLMTPAANLRDLLRRYGYTVYDIGNESHLTHEPPEDHTPYSETSYPGDSVYGVGYAIDIMPPPAGSGLPSLQLLGARLLADRKAGVPGIRWLKYMNWEPERNNGGDCWHESWQPNYARRSSSDRGHIHLSGLTGYESSTIGAGYDPVARIRGGSDDMSEQAENEIHQVYVGLFNGGSSMGRRVDPDGAGALPSSNSLVAKLDYLLARLDGVAAGVASLAGKDWTDEPAIIAGVLAGLSPQLLGEALKAAGLTPEAFAAAVPPEMAKQVVDELLARLNAGTTSQAG